MIIRWSTLLRTSERAFQFHARNEYNNSDARSIICFTLSTHGSVQPFSILQTDLTLPPFFLSTLVYVYLDIRFRYIFLERKGVFPYCCMMLVNFEFSPRGAHSPGSIPSLGSPGCGTRDFLQRGTGCVRACVNSGRRVLRLFGSPSVLGRLILSVRLENQLGSHIFFEKVERYIDYSTPHIGNLCTPHCVARFRASEIDDFSC